MAALMRHLRVYYRTTISVSPWFGFNELHVETTSNWLCLFLLLLRFILKTAFLNTALLHRWTSAEGDVPLFYTRRILILVGCLWAACGLLGSQVPKFPCSVV